MLQSGALVVDNVVASCYGIPSHLVKSPLFQAASRFFGHTLLRVPYIDGSRGSLGPAIAAGAHAALGPLRLMVTWTATRPHATSDVSEIVSSAAKGGSEKRVVEIP